MKAIAVIPKENGSAHVVDAEKPSISDNEILVKTLYTGVCSTDLEINQGLYGTAPEDTPFLILGHESLGKIEAIAPQVEGFQVGDLVVPTVRRNCPGCINCDAGASDMCLTGGFKERGIGGLHGEMSEYFADSPENLVKIPESQEKFAVLLEPLSVVEKGISQALKMQERLEWAPKKALVLGAGPIGLLATLLLRNQDIETHTVATREKDSLKARLVGQSGAKYINAKETPVHELQDKYDFILDATGNSKIAFDSLNLLNINGVLCLTSVTGGNKTAEIPIDRLNIEMVLGNKTIFGTVNANRTYFESGVKHFAEFEEKWPGLLGQMITKKVYVDDFKTAFEKDREDIKVVITFEK